MRRPVKRLLYWTPRVIVIAFALFISLFALDVFSEGRGFWETALALMMHLIPTAFIVLVLVISWRWEWVGAVMFSLAGGAYMIMTPRHPQWWVAISGPLFLIAILFLLSWIFRKEIREDLRKDDTTNHPQSTAI